MELRQYWHIIWKRVWIVVALLVVVLIGSLAVRAKPTPLYQATMRFLVGVAPEARTGDYYTYDRYYTWLSSEYLADDLSEVVKGSALADDVSAYLAQGEIPITVSPGAIQGSTVAEKQHRILTLRITWGNADELAAIANAVAEVLPQNGPDYFATIGVDQARFTLFDRPVVVPVGKSLRVRLDLPIRLFLALLAGVALTFLLDYLDDTVRDQAELEAMGITVLGEIPRRSREPGIRKPWLKLRSAFRR
jgi:capsular polysaccharide biosynthesis protein